MFKVQVSVSWRSDEWITIAIFATREAAQRDIDERQRHAFVKLDMRIKEED